MKYHFANITEFDDFIRDAKKKGTFSESEVKIKRETIRDLNNWNWLEQDHLYLTTNSGGQLYYVYRHPRIGFHYVWWHDGEYYEGEGVEGATNGIWEMDDLGGDCWVTRFIKLEGSSNLFMNWFDENPLGVKE